MKVSIEQTVDITDDQRYQMGALIDKKVKPKRQATRAEIKQYIWERGHEWDVVLADEYADEFAEDAAPAPDPEEAAEDEAEDLSNLI